MPLPATIVWFRRDLRLHDNPALSEAVAAGGPVVPLYIDEGGGAPTPWPASRWWLGESLAALNRDLTALGAPLAVRRGDPGAVLLELSQRTGARTICWNRRYEPAAVAADAAVEHLLRRAGLAVRSFKASLLFEPWEIGSRAGEPFHLFAAFWRRCQELPPPPAVPAPAAIPGLAIASDAWPATESAESAGWAEAWQPGEAAAWRRLEAFLKDGIIRYAVARDHPDHDGTSRLSPHIAFGEIGPRQIWHAVGATTEPGPAASFLRELGWREFSRHLLHHHPELPERPLRAEFARFPWASEETPLALWRDGQTGYPIVDAGMRALRRTGWLHNRMRMIVASFLVKDLLLPWQWGEAWFAERLVDADLAANAANWQWVAGCGVDSAPFFRIFNPVLQGEKFDARGRYVRQWVPELAGLPDLFIHRPWQAPPDALAEAGVRLGESYPLPIVDHGAARRRALSAYEQTRSAGAA